MAAKVVQWYMLLFIIDSYNNLVIIAPSSLKLDRLNVTLLVGSGVLYFILNTVPAWNDAVKRQAACQTSLISKIGGDIGDVLCKKSISSGKGNVDTRTLPRIGGLQRDAEIWKFRMND
ncbi:hypothetical protein H8356DRAFT_1331145 [Neocallimastix lanati (nom. inval.)]|nr:hypothetical protein H8356DRAFT_1331145 [Neocallimastix sp. JGI-2020a]